MSKPEQSWDAPCYDASCAFVWRHGESVLDLLDPKSGERILDLGCGTGRLTARIAETGARAVGLDQSAEMLAQARAAYPDLEFVQGDACDFTFAEPFDALFSNAVLHWIKQPESAIRCVANALRAGGRFVAELGGRGNVRVVEAAMRTAAAKVGAPLGDAPWHFPGVAEYASLLEAAGMEVRLALLFDRPTPLEGESGLRDWVAMFGRWALESVPADRRDDFLRAVDDAARPDLRRDGGWFADYRRLRVVAYRQPNKDDRDVVHAGAYVLHEMGGHGHEAALAQPPDRRG